jgi:hypothetical protein
MNPCSKETNQFRLFAGYQVVAGFFHSPINHSYEKIITFSSMLIAGIDGSRCTDQY